MDNLIKWKMVVVNRCIMCKFSCETIEQLLLHCPIASELWSFVHSFQGKIGDAKAGYSEFSYVLSFENEELSLEEIMKSFLRCLFEYSTSIGGCHIVP